MIIDHDVVRLIQLLRASAAHWERHSTPKTGAGNGEPLTTWTPVVPPPAQ
jgi:hypothetical protein